MFSFIIKIDISDCNRSPPPVKAHNRKWLKVLMQHLRGLLKNLCQLPAAAFHSARCNVGGCVCVCGTDP